MKILVTGYRGFIGSHLYKRLKELGHNVDGFEWGDKFYGVFDYDWVLHIGAISSTTEKDVDRIMSQNFDFSVMLYEECKKFGVNFQFSSSASIYGLGTNFSESAMPDPRTPYAWSKYLVERYIRNRQSGIISQIFRYFNVYGTGEEHKGNQASPFCQFKLQADRYNEITVFENSENYFRDFVPVEQIVDTQIKFLNSNESGTFNIGTGTTQSFMDVARSFKVPIKTKPMPDDLKLSYQPYTCADMTKTLETIKKIKSI
jgi:ADP-L-glycero-D-manno-heptose 6-epimerase